MPYIGSRLAGLANVAGQRPRRERASADPEVVMPEAVGGTTVLSPGSGAHPSASRGRDDGVRFFGMLMYVIVAKVNLALVLLGLEVMFGIAHGTVKSRTARALEKLKEAYGPRA